LTGTGTLTVSGTLNWSGGTFGGSGATIVAASGTLAISGSATKVVDARVLTNAGSGTWSDPGALFLSSGAVLSNSGTFVVQNDISINFGGGTPAAINNAGTLIKAGSSGTTTLGGGINFNNSGTVDVQSGTLTQNGAGTSHGTFHTASGTAVNFAGNGTV